MKQYFQIQMHLSLGLRKIPLKMKTWERSTEKKFAMIDGETENASCSICLYLPRSRECKLHWIQSLLVDAIPSRGVYKPWEFQIKVTIREGCRKKSVKSMDFYQTPPGPPPPQLPGLVFFTKKKINSHLFWKLNLWLPKRILHLVPLKNLLVFSS